LLSTRALTAAEDATRGSTGSKSRSSKNRSTGNRSSGHSVMSLPEMSGTACSNSTLSLQVIGNQVVGWITCCCVAIATCSRPPSITVWLWVAAAWAGLDASTNTMKPNVTPNAKIGMDHSQMLCEGRDVSHSEGTGFSSPVLGIIPVQWSALRGGVCVGTHVGTRLGTRFGTCTWPEGTGLCSWAAGSPQIDRAMLAAPAPAKRATRTIAVLQPPNT